MKKVLVIDDDVTFQLTMSNKLKEAGYEAISALGGDVGMDKALNEHPDVILLDIKMPKLDGMSMLKQLQEKKEVKVPVFITSNLSGLEHISEGLDLGIKGYIIKSDESLHTIITAIDAELKKHSEAGDPEAKA